MKTNNLFKAVTYIAATLTLVGCVFDNIATLEDNPSTAPGTIEVAVNMPVNSPQTRISLEQDWLDINLAWQEEDELDLLVVYGTKQERQRVTVQVDLQNNKKATFSLTLPKGDYEKFDLYGVYGGGGLSATPNEHLFTLPTDSESVSGTLEGIQNSKTLVLTFEEKGIPKASPSISTAFQHLGSLFKISLKNISKEIIENIIKAELVATEDIPAHRNLGSATYNVLTGVITGTETDGITLSFNRASANFADGEILEFWGWYIPTGTVWPALTLRIETNDGVNPPVYYESSNEKPKRATAPEIGKAYHFFAVIAKTEDTPPVDELSFTGPHFIKFGSMADSRDGTTYITVDIGEQTWIAENIKYFPDNTSLNGPTWESMTHPYCYVYGYEGSNIEEAKATDNYKTYGFLYNWYAAATACPDGWHLPSIDEWEKLAEYLARNGYNYDGSLYDESTAQPEDLPGDKIGKAMAMDSGWNYSGIEGAVGNTDYPAYRNKFGFSALPSGCRPLGYTPEGGGYKIYEFREIGEIAYFWSSTESVEDEWASYRGTLNYTKQSFAVGGEERSNWADGLSVRCIKD